MSNRSWQSIRGPAVLDFIGFLVPVVVIYLIVTGITTVICGESWAYFGVMTKYLGFFLFGAVAYHRWMHQLAIHQQNKHIKAAIAEAEIIRELNKAAAGKPRKPPTIDV